MRPPRELCLYYTEDVHDSLINPSVLSYCSSLIKYQDKKNINKKVNYMYIHRHTETHWIPLQSWQTKMT